MSLPKFQKLLWSGRYLTVQKKNRWSEADKSEFTTLDGYCLWDSPQLQKIRQKCPILEGKNTKNSSKRSQGAETRAKEILVHFPSLSASSRSFWAALTCGKAARLRMDVPNMDRTYGPNNFWSSKRQGPTIVHICAIFQTLNLHVRLTWIEQSQTNNAVIATKTPPAEESLEPRSQVEIGGHLSAIFTTWFHPEIDGQFLYFVFSL